MKVILLLLCLSAPVWAVSEDNTNSVSNIVRLDRQFHDTAVVTFVSLRAFMGVMQSFNIPYSEEAHLHALFLELIPTRVRKEIFDLSSRIEFNIRNLMWQSHVNDPPGMPIDIPFEFWLHLNASLPYIYFELQNTERYFSISETDILSFIHGLLSRVMFRPRLYPSSEEFASDNILMLLQYIEQWGVERERFAILSYLNPLSSEVLYIDDQASTSVQVLPPTPKAISAGEASEARPQAQDDSDFLNWVSEYTNSSGPSIGSSSSSSSSNSIVEGSFFTSSDQPSDFGLDPLFYRNFSQTLAQPSESIPELPVRPSVSQQCPSSFPENPIERFRLCQPQHHSELMTWFTSETPKKKRKRR